LKKRTFKDYLKYFTPVILITLAGFLVAHQFVQPAPPRHITTRASQYILLKNIEKCFKFKHLFSIN